MVNPDLSVRRVRKKPVEVMAMQYHEGFYKEVVDWVSSLLGVAAADISSTGLGSSAVISISTLEGDVTARVGDWIIRGVAGEFYPCKPEIFDRTYDVLDEPPSEPEQTSAGHILYRKIDRLSGSRHDCRPPVAHDYDLFDVVECSQCFGRFQVVNDSNSIGVIHLGWRRVESPSRVSMLAGELDGTAVGQVIQYTTGRGASTATHYLRAARISHLGAEESSDRRVEVVSDHQAVCTILPSDRVVVWFEETP
jgi:hypothetical protein